MPRKRITPACLIVPLKYKKRLLPNSHNSKLVKKYLEADLYINLSRIESFGITFIEALASNIPIVTFNTKGVNEIVTDNYNGFVIPEISNSLMVNKIHELCLDFSKVLSVKENTLKSVQIYDLNIILPFVKS